MSFIYESSIPLVFCPFTYLTYLQQKKLLSPLGCSPKIHNISCTKSQIGEKTAPPKKNKTWQKKTRQTHIQKNAAKISTSFSTIQHGFMVFFPFKNETSVVWCQSDSFLDFPSVKPGGEFPQRKGKFQRRFFHIFQKLPRRNPFEKNPWWFWNIHVYIHPRSFNSEFAPEKWWEFLSQDDPELPIGFLSSGLQGRTLLLNFGTVPGTMVEKNQKNPGKPWLVGGWTNPSEKDANVKWVHLPQGSGWK